MSYSSFPDAPTNKQINGAANKIKEMFETLKKDWNDFSSPLRKENTKLVIKRSDNQKIVYIIQTIHSGNALESMGICDSSDEIQIRNVFYFIEEDIKRFAKYVNNILHNYQEIKKRIGDKQLRENNKELKRLISNTHKRLYELKNEYVWDV